MRRLWLSWRLKARVALVRALLWADVLPPGWTRHEEFEFSPTIPSRTTYTSDNGWRVKHGRGAFAWKWVVVDPTGTIHIGADAWQAALVYASLAGAGRVRG